MKGFVPVKQRCYTVDNYFVAIQLRKWDGITTMYTVTIEITEDDLPLSNAIVFQLPVGKTAWGEELFQLATKIARDCEVVSYTIRDLIYQLATLL